MQQKKNKLILSIVLMLVSTSFLTSFTTVGEENNFVEVSINVDSYQITETKAGHELKTEGFGHNLIAGYPDLPSKILSIAIPPDAELKEISFSAGERVVIPGRFEVKPVPIVEVIGEANPEVVKRDKSTYSENYEQIYTNDNPYPAKNVELVRKSGFRKYNLVDVRVTPFSYKPVSQELVYFPEITVRVYYTYSKDSIKIMNDNLPRTESRAERIVTNYDEAQRWYPPTTAKSSLYDYVIITLDYLTTAVNPLVAWENAKGRSVNVVTTSWIESTYNGYDTAEKIRNFLRDKYPSSEWGIEDVLLVGHWDQLPMRQAWQDQGYGKPDTDFYYAELSLPDNQSWDINGNHRWGENSDPVDMYAEINVGRIPSNEYETVMHICNKSIAYEQNDDPSYKYNILLLGAFFWYDTDNAVLMEYKTNPSIHPWMANWTNTKLYEQSQSSYPCDYDLNYANVQSVWSSGTYSFVNWAGHGSYHACYEYYPSTPFVDTDTCQYLNDDYPAIIFADACSNSETDYPYNIGTKMLEQGAVGFLGSTKVAYGMHAWNDPTDGSSQSLDYFFTSCITSGAYTMGQAHQYGLAEMYTHGYWYYDRFETFEWGALWGNPDIGITYYPPEVDYNIANPQPGWNFISLNFQLPDLSPGYGKSDIKVIHNTNEYSWSDAVSAGLINDFLFGWNRDTQSYVLSTILKPGHGYWLYATDQCELWAEDITIYENTKITDLKQSWNVIGSAFDQPISKNDVIVNYNDAELTWLQATSNNNPLGSPIINDFISGWNAASQTYELVDTFYPGQAYWIYANENCILYRPEVT